MRKFVHVFSCALIAIAAGFPAEAARSECGVDGTLSERIADCGEAQHDICEGTLAELLRTPRFCSITIVHGSNGRRFVWRLVARRRAVEVWRDETSGLVWTEKFEKRLGVEGATTLCRFARNGNLALTAGLQLPFRLPRDADFGSGASHGLAAVLHGLSGSTHWSASGDVAGAHLAAFSGEPLRYVVKVERDPKAPNLVRCVSDSDVEPSTIEGDFKAREGGGPAGHGSGGSQQFIR